jgi:very-short-patch-repair endonuclease
MVMLRIMLRGPFRGTEALSLGLLSRDQLYGRRFSRVFPDVYAPADLTLDLAARSRAAYLLVRDRAGVLAGYSAAQLLGADCAPRNAPAEVLVPVFVRKQPGLRVVYGPAADAEPAVADGCRVTAPLRTAWDLARRLPLVEAVVAVDSLARAGGFAPEALLDLRSAHPGAKGSRRLDEIVRLADSRAESPPETRLRVALVRAGLPTPEVRYRVEDEYGYVLARLDLAYPEVKLAIEYDGAAHLDPRRTLRDRERDAILAGYGWETRRLGTGDLDVLPQTIERIRNLLVQRSR